MLNKCIFMGRLTKDPELRYTKQDNIPVAKFSIAVDRDYTKGDQKITDFFDVETWRAKAEFVSKYFTKGRLIVVVGRLERESWTDQNTGEKKFKYIIIADECHFADSKKKEDESVSQENESDTSFDPFAA